MQYQEINEELKKIIQPILDASGLELVELIFIRMKGRPILRLLIDRPAGGISVDECSRVNKLAGQALDESNLMAAGYILEVSSPGLDRPLKTANDFKRSLNKKVKFFLKEPVNERIELDGVIISADLEKVSVDTQGGSVEIPLEKINKAKLII